MQDETSRRGYFTLFELNNMIRNALESAIPGACWVLAEIAEAKCNQKGHCYLDLVEKKDEKIIAQLKANIWSYEYRKLGNKFETATGESLTKGMKIMFLAELNFHEVYGLSLGIKDIDPVYTLGEMARKRREVIDRLVKEGIIERNKTLALPLVPQRVAVISSPTAAGYGDFINQLDCNMFGYGINHVLFPALMQGEESRGSIVSALDEIGRKRDLFDIAVILRGGGSAVDLACFDDYAVCRAVALCPIPVIAGIGHQRDDTVVDTVAHTKMKTPTAVAEFVISGFRAFEERIMGLKDRINICSERSISEGRSGFERLIRGLDHVPLRVMTEQRHRLTMVCGTLREHAGKFLSAQENAFRVMEKSVEHLDPANIVRRGYSITRHKGSVVRDSSTLKRWAVIETTFARGQVKSIVQEKKEERKIGEGETAELLPGFE